MTIPSSSHRWRASRAWTDPGPRDAIPALTDPALESPESASAWLADDARVVLVEVGDEAVAVPLAILNAHEVAELLGVSPKTVYEAARNNQIPHRRLGRRLIFERGVVLE